MFDDLIKVVRTLRRRCPWDRKQTLRSTRPLLLNEVFELDEALRRGDEKAIKEELGDYLFMGVFLARLLEEKKGLKLEEVIRGVVEKLKIRHPHVYGKLAVKGAEEVLKNWEKIKRGKSQKSILAGIPVALPALQQAQLIQERCRRVGFDWDRPLAVLDKVEEEIAELREVLPSRKGRSCRVKEELGDLLFTLVNLCRHLGVDAEGALKDANRKFQQRFVKMENSFRKKGKDPAAVSLAEMEEMWQRAKKTK